MNADTLASLIAFNRDFYTHHGADFSRTRQGWPPGFERILPYLGTVANVLDVGCGNGRLAVFLAERGWQGRYLGVDSSGPLLDAAQADTRMPAWASFAHVDLLDPGWPATAASFSPDAIACLAVLHHIPGAARRCRLVVECARLLPPDGRFIVSTWQFITAPRLAGHILPWSTVGLRAEDVEPGDYLLSWGQGGAGRRYCAAIDQAALDDLAAAAGLIRNAAFYADGHEENLGLYGVYRVPPSP